MKKLDIIYFVVMTALAVTIVVLVRNGLSERRREETPTTDPQTYKKMVERATQLVRMEVGSERRMTMEESCEYQELCSRIGKYRVDHSDAK